MCNNLQPNRANLIGITNSARNYDSETILIAITTNPKFRLANVQTFGTKRMDRMGRADEMCLCLIWAGKIAT